MSGRLRVDEVRARNRALVLRALRRGGALSRTELAAATGLSAATLSSIAGALIAERVLAAADAPGPAARGRPQAPLRLDPARGAALGASVSAEAVRLRLVDYAGAVIAAAERPALPPGSDAGAVVAALAAAIAGLRAAAPGAPPLAVAAVAAQGVVDPEGRRLLWSPILAARGADLAGPLGAAIGAPVSLHNDCALIAEALRWARPDLGPDFAVALVGSGVGMGLVLGGRVFEGRSSSAVEFGHMTHVPGGAPCRCGRLGCVEAYAADYGVLRAAGVATRGLDADSAAVARLAAAARAGGALARAAFDGAGAALGYGFGRLFALVGPLRLVLVGAGAQNFDLMERAARAALADALAPELSGPLDIEPIADEAALTLDGLAVHALRRLDEALAARAPLAGAA
jgi:predicted NBD/HSP70 family sugar kinase